MVVTLTSCSIEDGVPPEEVSPQPRTVAVMLMYKDSVEAGKHMGATVVEMLRDCRPGGSFGKDSVAGSSDTGHSARDRSSNLGPGSQDQKIEIICVL